MRPAISKETCRMLSSLFVLLNLSNIFTAVTWFIISYSLRTGKVKMLASTCITLNYVLCVLSTILTIGIVGMGILGFMKNFLGVLSMLGLSLFLGMCLMWQFKVLNACQYYVVQVDDWRRYY